MTVAIVNYGVGNVGSLKNMLTRKCGVQCQIFDGTAEMAEDVSHCILPGVGHFGFAAEQLRERGIVEKLQSFVDRGGRLLGICLGAQLLLDRSEEGHADGLGFIPGKVVKFKDDQLAPGERIPNMGWSETQYSGAFEAAWSMGESRFYFVHSYHMVPRDEENIFMTAGFGGGFTAAVRRGNVTGVQFHPEKSHTYGISFLKSWLAES